MLRWIIIAYVRKWYVSFSAGFFVVVALLAGIIQPGISVMTGQKAAMPIFQGDTANANVAFACNVFWGEEHLPKILEICRENNMKITFFIGGSWAKRYPEMLQQIALNGHEIGNHSYSHPHPNALDKEKNKLQIARTEELIQQLTSIRTTLYAPPYGEYNDTVLLAASEMGYKTIMWSIDTIDWKRPTASVIHNRVLKKIHNGAIILMHPTAPTVEALPKMINEIKERGYVITSVSDVL